MNVAILIDRAMRDVRTTGVYFMVIMKVFAMYMLLHMTGLDLWDHYLTFSAVLQTVAFGLLVMKVQKNDVGGLSPSSLCAYCLAYLMRLWTTLTMNGYLPEDALGDLYIYQLAEITGLALAAYCCKTVFEIRQQATSYLDEQQHESPLVLIAMLTTVLVLGFCTMSDAHDHFLGDWSWMSAAWLESIAIAPQLWLVAKNREVERRTSHFIAVSFAARVCAVIFWATLLMDTAEEFAFSNFILGIAVANLLHIFLCLDYMYYFIKTMRGSKLSLPASL